MLKVLGFLTHLNIFNKQDAGSKDHFCFSESTSAEI